MIEGLRSQIGVSEIRQRLVTRKILWHLVWGDHGRSSDFGTQGWGHLRAAGGKADLDLELQKILSETVSCLLPVLYSAEPLNGLSDAARSGLENKDYRGQPLCN